MVMNANFLRTDRVVHDYLINFGSDIRR